MLELGFPPSAAFNQRKAEVKENRERVVEAIRTVVGASLRPVYVTLDGEPEDAGGAEAEASEADPARSEDELYERFVSEFDAEVMLDDEPERREETS